MIETDVDTQAKIDPALKKKLKLFAFISWGVSAALAVRGAYRWGQGVGASAAVSETATGEVRMGAVATEFIVGLVETTPLLLFVFVLFLLGAHFHGMTRKGVFNKSFANAIEAAAGILMISSVWIMCVAPTVRASVEGGFKFVWNTTDFGLGVLGVGVVLTGLALVMKEAVKLKTEMDSYI